MVAAWCSRARCTGFCRGRGWRRSSWGSLDGGLEALDALLRGGGVDAADVVLEGAELDSGGGGEEGLEGYAEAGVDLAGDLPGDGVLDVEEAGELGGVCRGGGHAQVVDLEDLGLDGDAVGGSSVGWEVGRRCSCLR